MAVQRVSPAEAKALVDQGYIYLDVRSVPEYESGHPVGAVNAPIMHFAGGGMQPNPDFMAVVTRAYAKDAKLVIGCKSGVRSQRAAMMLEGAGFAGLVEMRGGFGGEADGMGRLVQKGWAAEGLPVETVAAPGASWQELAKKA